MAKGRIYNWAHICQFKDHVPQGERRTGRVSLIHGGVSACMLRIAAIVAVSYLTRQISRCNTSYVGMDLRPCEVEYGGNLSPLPDPGYFE